MRIIEHYHQPKRLLLVWQAREHARRSRHVVGELRLNDDGEVNFSYLVESDDFAAAKDRGFDGYPAFDVEIEHHNQGVMSAFMRRLPPKSRADFSRYLELHRINAGLSDFQLLAYTGAKLTNDGFEIVCLFDETPAPFEFMAEVAGYRHHADLSRVAEYLEQPATFEAEPDNEQDPNALAVNVQGKKIGYVDRVRACRIKELMASDANISAHVDRINGTPDRPLLHLFVSVR